jgi:hypothetical protein
MAQSGNLGEIDGAAEERVGGPGKDGVDEKAAARERHWRQQSDDLHAVRVQANLLLGLTEGGGHRVAAVTLVQRATGKDELVGVVVQIGGAFGQQHAWSVRPVA